MSRGVADAMKFDLHKMFFPATEFLSSGKIGMVAAVIGLIGDTRRLMNFLADPSLTRMDW
ncbi:MAG TPA: hypothetical protein VMJ35_10900 [Dongiaceae bacterium]|nr:hypothetical protein [Dongiaceae bacterium]